MVPVSRNVLAALMVATLCLGTITVALSAAPQQPGPLPGGSLEGVLEDPNDLPITGLDPSTQIVLTNMATGRTYRANVVLNGSYSIANLPPGQYRLQLTILSAMYQSYEQRGIQITGGQTRKLDLAIKWGMNLGTIGDDPVLLSNDLLRRSKYVDGPAPKRRDGHPDLTGEWDQKPKRSALFELNKVPMKPWAKAIWDQEQDAMKPQMGKPGNQGPGVYCLPYGATPDTQLFPLEFIQSSTRLVELIEFDTPGFREIYLDGRKHPEPDVSNPSWYGHSVGHWEGDTLVVDTVGFNAVTPGYGIHTEALHVVERINRRSRGTLTIDVTATDPKAWTGPYHRHIEEGLITNDDINEWVCAENNETYHFAQETWLDLMRRLMASVPANMLEDNRVEKGGAH